MGAHVVVIGAGVAGCAAALEARKHGAEVTLVHRSVGATALSTGGALLDGGEEARGLLVERIGLVEAAGSYLLTTGAVQRMDLVMPSHERGEISGLVDRSVLVVGLDGFTGTSAPDLARRLERRGVRAAPARVQVPGLRMDRDLSAFALARHLDDVQVAGELAAAIPGGGHDLVALPPVFGLEQWREVGRILDETLTSPWFELLSSPPSVPGLRLQQNLMESLRIAGVRTLKADVKLVRLAGESITLVRAWDGEVAHDLEPDEVVLATGRFIGGGVSLDSGGRETLLGLELEVGSGDEILATGVEVDDELRPPGFANVRVAGAVRRSGSYALGQGGIGRAAAQGLRAGALASRSPGAKPSGPVRSIEAMPRPGQEGCLGCEVCSSVCPVLDRAAAVGTWYPGPRGLGTLSRSGPLLEAGGETLALCTLCGACSAMCPVGARNHETVAALRGRLLADSPDASPEPHRLIPEVLESSGNVYGSRLEPVEGPRRSDADLAFFPGCAMSYFERESAGAFVDLLESLGISFSVVDGVCCGGPLDVLGLAPSAEAIRHNRGAVEATGARTLVATCPRCVHRLSHDLDGIQVEHSLETLERLLPGSDVLDRIRENLAGRVVTYHDPCELGRYRGRYDGARRIMELVGVELVEMEHARERSACCGAGGGLRGVNPRLSREISRRRVAEAVETGAGALLTECPSCLHNLRTGRKRRQKIEVEDLTALLGRAATGSLS
jgi:Fe-S oxidoreductase/anaerobic glycerol-3-phosphate dehydrogenase